MTTLNSLVALVTGASRGAGRGIALELGSAGATVYVTGRSVDGGPTTDDVPGTIGGTVALASDATVIERSGQLVDVGTLALEYGFTDVDGRKPHLERRWNELYGENNSPMGPAKLPISWGITPAPQPKPPTVGVA